MNNNKIYTQNYYNLKRRAEEDDFIDELNRTNIPDLALPTLQNVLDRLYEEINDVVGSKSPLAFSRNEVGLNRKLEETLSKNKLYEAVKDNKITSNLFSNALLKLNNRLFEKNGVNDEGYLLQSYISYWLENNLAKALIKDVRFKSYVAITKVLYQAELLHHFYDALKDTIPYSWIDGEREAWTGVKQDQKNILDSIRSFDKEYFLGYEAQLVKYQAYSSWKYIYESTRFSDHAMFNDEYAFKNRVLLERSVALWVKFWDNLKLPILQDIPFIYIENPSYIKDISRELVKRKDSINTNPKHLAFILLNNLFENVLRVQENLSFYIDSEKISALSQFERHDKILTKGAELYALWEDEKITIYSQTFQSLLEIVSIDEMSEWVFTYSHRSTIRGDYDAAYNTEVDRLVTAFNPYIGRDTFESQIQHIDNNFNLRKFDFLAKQIDGENNKAYAEILLNSLTKYVRTDSFYWDGTFSSTYWPTLKSIGRLISLLSDPVAMSKSMINDFKVIHEGWNIAKIDYRLTQAESFIYCGNILLLEHESVFTESTLRDEYFNYLLKVIISQTRFNISKINNDYTLPLYLLGLVVNQMYPELKNFYELSLIEDLDDLNTIVAILSNDNYELSQDSEKLLRARVEIEFNLKKRQFMQRGQSEEIVKLENGIKKLNILLN